MESQADQFIRDLLECAHDNPMVRLRLLAKLIKWGGQTVYLPVEDRAAGRAAAAQKMLASGMSNADAADAIRMRFGCSKRTAERTISAVRNSNNLSQSHDATP